jgi:hypothetical protein
MSGRLLACVLLVFVALGSLGMAGDDARPLVRGDDPSQFELVGIGPESLSIADGEIRMSGKPEGYFATKDAFADYELSFEWMYERPDGLASDEAFEGNGGLLLHIEGELKVWPRSIELQLMNREVGQIYPIEGAVFDGRWDAAAAKRAVKPVGQWNQETVTSRGGELTCELNGVVVTTGKGAKPARGRIGWQSEGAPMRLRKIMIEPL